jgi:two-component system OmpR family sensor kinase
MKFAPSKWSLRVRLMLATFGLATIAIVGSDFAAHIALKNYLISQVDSQLDDVASRSVKRVDRAGIDPNPNGERDDKHSFRAIRPLGSVPTSTQVTLLDLEGHVVGSLGGDFTNQIEDKEFSKLTPAEVVSHQGRPFTIRGEDGNSDLRALASLLPSGVGTVVVSIAFDSIDNTLNKLTGLFILISLVILLMIIFVSRAIINISLRPLTKIEDKAAAIAEGDLSVRLPEVNPNTEVGRLTTSLNTMLGRIEDAFDVRTKSESRLRRFVADASHELRTPLTAIRGFAELHRQGAVSGAEKTKELIHRIEKESIRMSSLVEDLLLLARLDQAPQVHKEPVDLTHLINEAVESARAAGPDHPITVLVADETFILGDSMRIHQAVANLLANARTHTPAGTNIAINVEQSESELTITVSDDGPGLSAADQERIFERFFRADPSRQRSAGEGSGLGLAIVDAVMKAHGGSVTVASEIGKGAAFTLHFPITKD